MEMIEDTLNKGKTAIVLVPEISLTPQTIKRFSKRFGSRIALLHSALSDGERYDEWRKINREEVDIVIGARSALFAPVKNLGLIVIDEEHSTSYKQDDQNPRYDGIEMAKERIKLNKGAKLVLGSATPTLDSYARALKKVYHLLEMPTRVNNKSLPKVNIVDMNEEIRTSKGHFSKVLISKIEEKIKNNEQIILLLNRRGYSNYIMCRSCGAVRKCPNCDVSLTYHDYDKTLKCHYCNYQEKAPIKCPKCGSSMLDKIGTGTEKVEEELHTLFPGAKVVRMDNDTTRGKQGHEKVLYDFEYNGDILIGTQMIAKGLDFPNVTLVGVLNADQALNIPDYRSKELTFELLTQVSGRAGRGDKPGLVVVQTYDQKHYAIKYGLLQDYLGFYEEEMKFRKLTKFIHSII
jgi:primosomal protein N' (replication factor Y)